MHLHIFIYVIDVFYRKLFKLNEVKSETNLVSC